MEAREAARELERAKTRARVLQEITGRNHLLFLQTEIAIGYTSAKLASLGRRDAAKRQLATAREACRVANKFLPKARIDENTRKRLRRDLVQLTRAIHDARP